jgi:hypothetical protein
MKDEGIAALASGEAAFRGMRTDMPGGGAWEVALR